MLQMWNQCLLWSLANQALFCSIHYESEPMREGFGVFSRLLLVKLESWGLGEAVSCSKGDSASEGPWGLEDLHSDRLPGKDNLPPQNPFESEIVIDLL